MAPALIKMLYKMYKSICQVYESTCRYGMPQTVWNLQVFSDVGPSEGQNKLSIRAEATLAYHWIWKFPTLYKQET